MKKLLFIVCSLTITTLMTACGDDDKDDNKNGDVTIGQLNKTTWASLAKINTFMNDFPAYDGEIDNHTITNASGVDMLVFFDYACEQSEYDEYAAKLEATGIKPIGHIQEDLNKASEYIDVILSRQLGYKRVQRGSVKGKCTKVKSNYK